MPYLPTGFALAGGLCWSTDAPKLVVFDWDDTILPTSWLVTEQILMPPPNASRSITTARKRMTPQHREELAAIEAAAHRMLDAAEQLGKVILITNALTTWVENSGQALVPSIAARIAERYPVFARPFGMKLADMTSWKTYAFDREAEGFGTIVSVGDGPDERSACLTLPFRRVRSVKLLEDPCPADLIAQQVLVADRLKAVTQDESSVLDLETRRGEQAWKLFCVSKPVHSMRHTLSMTPVSDTRTARVGPRWDAAHGTGRVHGGKAASLRKAVLGLLFLNFLVAVFLAFQVRDSFLVMRINVPLAVVLLLLLLETTKPFCRCVGLPWRTVASESDAVHVPDVEMGSDAGAP